MVQKVDRNDVDQFGMDADTRKRLKVGRMLRARKKVRRPLNLRMPGKYRVKDDMHERVHFDTLGAKGSGTEDAVGYVTSLFFHSTPEFEKSLETTKSNRNGWVLRGKWPSSGKEVFDWEFDIFGERGKSVVVKFNMWDVNGWNDGQAYRVTVATVPRAVKKFLSKVFRPAKAKAQQAASGGLGWHGKKFSVSECNLMISEVREYLVDGINEAKSKTTPYQKAQRNRRQTIALHTPSPSKQSAFYKHAVRAIFNKLRKDGEGFKGAAKGGQLIAQWMLKKHGYATGSTDDPWADGGKFKLTGKGKKRNRKHTSEPKGVRRRKEAAYDHIMGIQRRAAARRKAVADKAKGAGS